MKTIIVPTDFSAVSANAARYAAAMAEPLHASITLFHAFPIPLAFSEVPVPSQVFDALQKDAEYFMAKAKTNLELVAPSSVKIHTQICPGTFLTGLREICDASPPYAVVMSSHGNAGLEHLLLGSETAATVKHLPWPLIVVPRGAKFKAPKKIALACDFERVSSTVPAGVIKDLVQTFGASLAVVHVHKKAKQDYKEEVIEGATDLQDMLADLHPSYHFLDDSADIAETILHFVEQNEIDLVIGFPKKRGLLEGLFHKSQTKALAQQTLVPFLAFHEHE